MRRNFWYLTITLVVVVGTFVATLLSGNRPVLGLDLQGGISVVLAPVGDVRNEASLDKAVDIIRSRVDALGVAEPEISRQGSNVIIDLPGVRDRDKARRLVGKTAELRFRPVLLAGLPPETKGSTTTTSTKPETSTTTVAGATTSSTAATTTTTTTPIKTSTPAEDKATATVILPGRKTDDVPNPPRYQLGPAALTGRGVSGAKAQFVGGQEGWTVELDLKEDGQAAFNQLAQESYPKQPPQNAVAIVLDGVVQSAPAFQTNTFDGAVQISGDFSESEAKDLATVLQYGALPVQLKELTTQSVSPTLGTDQLEAGIAAGVIGLALVALYMLLFYRLLGLVVIIGLMLAAMAMYSLISYLGSTIGLTLTLAGVTGLIVSVGVTVDSYVVYFEKLKDEVRTGRTVRSSVDRAFEKSFRTILAADLVSLIGAGVLYALAIGSVRGFAFFLGISVLLDLIIAYFFMHPMVYFMVQRTTLVKAPKVGIAAGLDAAGDGLMPRADGSRHSLKDLYHERTNFDFLHRRWRWALLSGLVLLAGALGLIVNGLNLGIDFTGGTVWELTAKQTPSSGDIRELVAPLGVREPKIVIVGSKGIRVQGADLVRAKQDEITNALAEYGGVERADVSVSDVGPTWGNQVSGKALRALIIFFLVIAVYLSLRFTIKMAAGAIIAVVHDIAITIGVYAITGFEVTPATVIAFLTILGFSLYDTVVVFDKIRENERLVGTGSNLTYTDMANTSLNQVLMRSLNTSFVALLPVASLLVVGVWIYGALALRDFGLALFVGLLTGAYSSIFVATPILAWLKEREPKHRAVAQRLETRAQRAAAPEYQGEAAEKVPAGTAPAPSASPSTSPRPAPGAAAPVITPRPRQQRGRKRK